MTSDAIKLLEGALQLAEKDRADFAARLIDSLSQQDDHEAPSAWDAEIARRIGEVESGSVKPVPWPEARRMILGASDAQPDP